MMYYKLIAISLDNYASYIFYEENYAMIDLKLAYEDKFNLETKGYLCLLTKVESAIVP